ncbi:MAG: homoserine dehydrogenase [Halobacteriaceae archaeon]
MNLAIVGVGAVGRSVAVQAGDRGHEVVALADSRGAVVDGDGVDLGAALERRDGGEPVGDQAPRAALEADYDVLIEATPTTLGDAQPGFGHVERALDRDRHVVLANKGPVAERYDDLQAVATDSAGAVRFEATVGGAIPAIAAIEGVDPNRVRAVRGVLNGTANFVLTRMAAEGLGFDHVLAEAQDLGVAEADPSFDVDGTDAALKCAILANLLRDGGVSLTDVAVAGIRDIPGRALDLAADADRTIRLVGEVTASTVRVGPRLVSATGELAVEGTTNVVQLETEHAGDLTLQGPGAGGAATATAVLADVDRLPPRP